MESIYLDHNATTPTRPEVIEAIARCLADGHANPASQHQLGQRARRVLEDARDRIAAVLGADLDGRPRDQLIFTGSATEANNLAIFGIAGSAPSTHRQVVISGLEHASVIEPAERLLEEGWRLDSVGANSQGVAHLDRFDALIGANTALVCLMLGNHETGVLQPVAELAALCRERGVPLHTDAVAAAGKMPINFRGLGTATMSVAAHKFGGPPAIGALLVRGEVKLSPLLLGGHQQSGLRAGTEPVALAVGMAMALEICRQHYDDEAGRLARLRDRLEAGVLAGYPEAAVHGATSARLPTTTNIAFRGLDGQILLLALDMAGVACSAGSACASGSCELSPTLRAMGLPSGLVASSMRLSLGAMTTEAEIDEAIRRILHVCRELRG